MVAAASPRVALDVYGGVLDRLWLEDSGEDPATGEPFIEVKLGLKLPLKGLIEALTKLQDSGLRTQPASGAAPCQRVDLPEQSYVVSKTFVEHDEAEAPQRAALLRTSTWSCGQSAEPRADQPASPDEPAGSDEPAASEQASQRGLGAVAEECDDQAEDAETVTADPWAGAPGLGCRTVTADPWHEDTGERPAWNHLAGVDASVFPTPAPAELPFNGIPFAVPWPVPVPMPVAADFGGHWSDWVPRPMKGEESIEETAKPSRKPDIESSSLNDGVLRVTWNASAKRIGEKSTDQSLVSPKINLVLGDANDRVPFTMTIRPKANGEGRGKRSFKEANKQGHIELTCADQSCLGNVAPDMTFSLVVGSDESRREKGPFTHNFAKERVFSVPKAQDVWEFARAIEGPPHETTSTFSVHLEIEKGDGGSWRCPTGGAAAAGGGAAAPPVDAAALPADGAPPAPAPAGKRW